MRHAPIIFSVTALAASLLVAPQVACARPLSEKVTERVVDSAIDSGLEALSKPENQRRLGQVLSSPAVTGGVHDIAFALVDGVLDGVEGRFKFDFDLGWTWKGFDDAAKKHVGPAVGAVTRSVVDAAMSSALSEANGVRVEERAAHSTFGVMRRIGQGIRHELGPALAHMVLHDLAPAGAAAMEHHVMPAISRGLADADMQASIALTMNSVARSLVRGGDAGIETAKAEASAVGEDGAMTLLGGRLSKGLTVGVIIAAGFFLLLVLLTALLLRGSRSQRRLADEGRRREDELRTMVERLLAQDSRFDTTTRIDAPTEAGRR